MIILVGKSVALLCFGGLVSIVSCAVVCGGWKCITKSHYLKAAHGLPLQIWRPCVESATNEHTGRKSRVPGVGNGRSS